MTPAETDPALEARDALVAAGVDVQPIGEELERWQVGMFVMSDADLWRLAASRGLVGNISERPPQLSRRQLTALRALYASPGGLRIESYPSVMAGLREVGLVRQSQSRTWPRRPVWLLTKAGRDLVKMLGTGEPSEP